MPLIVDTKLKGLMLECEKFMHSQVVDCDIDSKIAMQSLEHLQTGGRRLRAQLAISASSYLSVVDNDVISWAACCELLHNATLILDDIQDEDKYRRGVETLWSKYGKSSAMNAGHFLLMLPHQIINKISKNELIKINLLNYLSKATINLVNGQSLETSLSKYLGTELLLQKYIETIILKTSTLFEMPIYGSALLSGKCELESKKLSHPFSYFGIIFQMIDDLMDLMGVKGRPKGSDLLEGKVTYLVCLYSQKFPTNLEKLKKFLSKDKSEKTQSELDWWIHEFESAQLNNEVQEKVYHWYNLFKQSSLGNENPQLLNLGLKVFEYLFETVNLNFKKDNFIHE